jgi:glycosyltransferase involved in cell wall biosynthesis
MRREYVANGAKPERVHVLPPFGPRVDARSTRPRLDPARRRLIFVGRMERAKGGLLLIEALSEVRRALDGSLDLVFVGDGRDRSRWEAAATRLAARAHGVRISFTGWLPHDAVTDALAGADLLVLPGTWPEPFGLVGLEAAAVGVPAVAFDVGGIAQWLHDGVTGHLAAASPPSGTSLAQAILQALGDPDHYARLSAQARSLATVCTLERHARDLIAHLTGAAVPAAAHVNV